jgi:hypothetical protein
MTAILNGVRDSLLTEKHLEERQNAQIVCLCSKVALRMGAVALSALALSNQSAPALFGAYLALEGSMVAANAEEILENFSTEIAVRLIPKALEKQVFHNAPLCRAIYYSIR